jgi:DNA-binding NarL/FixJ family response regulator
VVVRRFSRREFVSKLFLISDQPVLLLGLRDVLEQRGFHIAECRRFTAFASARQPDQTPDVVLLDITAGLTLRDLADVHARFPDCPVVLWADPLPLDLVFRTLEFGVRGIVQPTTWPEQLADALTRVAEGEMQIGFGSARHAAPRDRNIELTPREREIVGCLRQGLSNKQIGAEMNIAVSTVKIYLFRLFHKMGVRSRFELASCAIPDAPGVPPVVVTDERPGKTRFM